MSKGLLAQWRRGIVARGMLGAILFAVPVAIAAAIGFGTSLSGVAGGLSSFAEGPDTTTTSSDAAPIELSRAVVAGASRPEAASERAGGGDVASNDVGGSVLPDGGTVDGGTTGESGGSGGGGSTGGAPTIDAPSIELPGGGGGGTSDPTGEAVDSTVNGVNGVLQGVGNTVNGILGQ